MASFSSLTRKPFRALFLCIFIFIVFSVTVPPTISQDQNFLSHHAILSKGRSSIHSILRWLFPSYYMTPTDIVLARLQKLNAKYRSGNFLKETGLDLGKDVGYDSYEHSLLNAAYVGLGIVITATTKSAMQTGTSTFVMDELRNCDTLMDLRLPLQMPGKLPKIPHVIWVAAMHEDEQLSAELNSSWSQLHPTYAISRFDATNRDEWIDALCSTIMQEYVGLTDSQLEVPVCNLFQNPPALQQADLRNLLFRILLLLFHGGICTSPTTAPLHSMTFYTSLDTTVDLTDHILLTLGQKDNEKPVDEEKYNAVRDSDPALVVTLHDLSLSPDDDRTTVPVRFLPWTFATVQAHPVLLDVIYRMLNVKLNEDTYNDTDEESSDGSSLSKEITESRWERMWSEAVARYLMARWGFDIRRVMHDDLLNKPVRVGDVLILPAGTFKEKEK